MMKKTTLLGSALAVTLSSAPAELQATTPAPLLEAAMGTTERGTECVSIDDSTADSWNAVEYCLVSDRGTSTTDFADVPVANKLPAAGVQLPQGTSGDGSPVDGSHYSPEFDALMAAECVSAGGSSATATAGGFCLGSDLDTSTAGSANLAVANSIPVGGLQFLQITFRDGSTLRGARNLPAGIDAECSLVGGSSAATDGGFCLGSNLSELTTSLVNLTVANSLPAAGMQYLQVTFSGRSPLVGSRYSPESQINEIADDDDDGDKDKDDDEFDDPDTGTPMGTKCSLVGGSSAATGNIGGFCMVSDLSTSTTDYLANFSIANNLPVEGMHFLQITFGDSNPGGGSRQSLGAGAPMGVECSLVGGSTAVTGNAGSCLVSELSTSATEYFAKFSVANGLPIAGMQYLQATFGDGNLLVGSDQPPGDGASIGAECVSVDGSTAATGNAGGFCLVADRGRSAIGYSNISFANDLPVADMRFLQIPFGEGRPRAGLRSSPSDGVPIGVVISDSVSLPFHRSPPPDLIIITGHGSRHSHISDPTRGFKPYSSRHRNRHPFLALGLNCESRHLFALPNKTRSGLLNQQHACVRSRVRWGRLRL